MIPKPQSKYLSENDIPNKWPSVITDSSAFSLASVIFHLYLGPVRLNKYLGIVKSSAILTSSLADGPIDNSFHNHLLDSLTG